MNTTRIGKMSVNSKGIDLWNVLPKAIKDSVSLEVFKKRVRKQLLDKYTYVPNLKQVLI